VRYFCLLVWTEEEEEEEEEEGREKRVFSPVTPQVLLLADSLFIPF